MKEQRNLPVAPPTQGHDAAPSSKKEARSHDQEAKKVLEFGGPQGLEPTRYGDWERKGRVSDF